jgi:hypothetical protein
LTPAGPDGTFEAGGRSRQGNGSAKRPRRWARSAAALGTIGRQLFNLLSGTFEPVPRPVLLAVLRRIAAISRGA